MPQRSTAQFIPFNCTAVPRDMLDSQLFGYRRGAFTGAQDAFPGVIRSAAGGTLFLDEIGEMALDVQPKLLRFLESAKSSARRAGAGPVDVRVVAATNADLDSWSPRAGSARICTTGSTSSGSRAAAARAARGDPAAARALPRAQLKEAGKTGVRIAEATLGIPPALRLAGQRARARQRGAPDGGAGRVGRGLMPEHLSPKIAASRRTVPASERPLEPTELVVRLDQPLSAAVEHLERALIQEALRSTGNVEEAARSCSGCRERVCT